MKFVKPLLGTLWMLSLVSCSKSFMKRGPDVGSAERPQASQTELDMQTGDVVINTTPDAEPRRTDTKVESADNMLALTQCLNQWQGLPEAQELAKKAIIVNLNSFAQDKLVWDDSKQTETAVLYLLNLNFDIPQAGLMHLRNRKGWYCLAINSKTIIDFNIDVACGTTIATATRAGQIYDRFNIVRDQTCP
jgi:hypothetical protein